MKTFSQKDALLFSAKTVYENYRFWFYVDSARKTILFVRALLLFFFVGFGLYKINAMTWFSWSWFSVMSLVKLGFLALFIVFEVLVSRVLLESASAALSVVDKKDVKPFKLHLWNSLVSADCIAFILYFSIVWAGLVWFVVPGLYCGVRFGFYRYALVDKKCSAFQALKISWQLTRGSVWKILSTYVKMPRMGNFILNAYMYKSLSEK